MRKFILITAMVLASATAQAGERSLTLSSDPTPAAASAKAPMMAETPQTIQAPVEMPRAAETPKYIERPALVEPKSEPPKTQQASTQPAKPAAEKTASAPKS